MPRNLFAEEFRNPIAENIKNLLGGNSFEGFSVDLDDRRDIANVLSTFESDHRDGLDENLTDLTNSLNDDVEIVKDVSGERDIGEAFKDIVGDFEQEVVVRLTGSDPVEQEGVFQLDSSGRRFRFDVDGTDFPDLLDVPSLSGRHVSEFDGIEIQPINNDSSPDEEIFRPQPIEDIEMSSMSVKPLIIGSGLLIGLYALIRGFN